MNIDLRTLPPRPRKSSLRVRFFPDEVRVRKISWSAGAAPTCAFIVCSIWIVHRLWSLFNFALAANGPNLAQLWAAAGNVLTGCRLDPDVTGGRHDDRVVRRRWRWIGRYRPAAADGDSRGEGENSYADTPLTY